MGERREVRGEGAELSSAGDLIEERLVIDILIQVLASLLAEHRRTPHLNHRK